MTAHHGIASYDEKVEHVTVVADRGAAARTQAEDAGQNSHRKRTARKVFRPMAVPKLADESLDRYLVLSDTPPDRSNGRVSKPWVKHVRRVFVASFVAAELRPEPSQS